MIDLPNPFSTSAAPQVAEQAIALPVHTPGTGDAMAEPFVESSMAIGGHQEAPAVDRLEPVVAGTFDDEHRFVLEEVAFLEAIEPLPLFLQAPLDVLNVLAAY